MKTFLENRALLMTSCMHSVSCRNPSSRSRHLGYLQKSVDRQLLSSSSSTLLLILILLLPFLILHL